MTRILVIALIILFVFVLFERSQAATGTCTVSTGVIDTQEQQFLVLLNQYRAQNGAAALTLSTTLTNAAAWIAEDLAAHNYFSHTDTLGRLPWDRAIACGYPNTGVGENIAGGRTSAQDTLAAWQSSAGHNANMLNPQWKVIGIARVTGGYWGRDTWVTDFGYIIDSVVYTPTPTQIVTPTPTVSPLSGCIYSKGWSFFMVQTGMSVDQLPACVTRIYVYQNREWLRWFREGPTYINNVQWLTSGMLVWYFVP